MWFGAYLCALTLDRLRVPLLGELQRRLLDGRAHLDEA